MPRYISSVTASVNSSDPTKADLVFTYTGTQTASTGPCGPSSLALSVLVDGVYYNISATGSYTTVPLPTGTHTFTVTSEETWYIWVPADSACDYYTGNSATVTSNSVTITAGDTTPDNFTFADLIDQARSTYVTSNLITVSGINTPVSISITGGEYSKNFGAWTSSTGTVSNADKVRLRVYSSSLFNVTNTATLTISSLSRSWNVSTSPAGTSMGVVYIQSSGAISMRDLWEVFGGPFQYEPTYNNLSDYYRGGTYVIADSYTTGIPSSGTISLSDFYSKGAEQFVRNNLSQSAFGYNPSSSPGATASCQVTPSLILNAGNGYEFYWTYTVTGLSSGISSTFPWNTWTNFAQATLVLTGANIQREGTFSVQVRSTRTSAVTTVTGIWYMEVSNSA